MARTIKRVYARYTEAFKAEAVRLASQPDFSARCCAFTGHPPLYTVTMEETITTLAPPITPTKPRPDSPAPVGVKEWVVEGIIIIGLHEA